MSVLDAFLSTWSNARATFGEGVPQPGAGYDQSASLTTLKGYLDQAAPGTHWSGGAATVYGNANTEHQLVSLATQLGRASVAASSVTPRPTPRAESNH